MLNNSRALKAELDSKFELLENYQKIIRKLLENGENVVKEAQIPIS